MPFGVDSLVPTSIGVLKGMAFGPSTTTGPSSIKIVARQHSG
jgi:hypothetical protein